MKQIDRARNGFAALSLALLAACGGTDRADEAVSASMAPTTGLHRWVLPSAPGAAQPDLVLAPDGRLLLSWLDSVPGRRTRLQFSDFDATATWGPTRTIAIGSSFFVNWADTPHLMATPNGMLWVQWLQKSGAGPYAYDVMLSNSRNDGMNWSAPIRVHDDGTVSEHGFAALWAQGNDRLGIAWLDGRRTAGGDDTGHREAGHVGGSAEAGEEHGAGRGAMTLRAASIDGGLAKAGDSEVDASVCDCCQTDVALTAKGPLLVYRDRTDAEIRDIYTMRHDGNAWSAGKPVHADNWTMPACPVNGPAVDARGNDVIVGWYTAANDEITVKLARSSDAGDTFATPVVFDQGERVQGRVDVALDGTSAWVLWLREEDAGQTLLLARYSPDLSSKIEEVEVARLRGKGRGTGFPQLALRDGAAWMVWTDIIDGQPRLEGASYVPATTKPVTPRASG